MLASKPCKKGGANNVRGVAHACVDVRRLAEYIARVISNFLTSNFWLILTLSLCSLVYLLRNNAFRNEVVPGVGGKGDFSVFNTSISGANIDRR